MEIKNFNSTCFSMLQIIQKKIFMKNFKLSYFMDLYSGLIFLSSSIYMYKQYLALKKPTMVDMP